MMEFKNPIPIMIKDTNQLGYAIYTQASGILENDVWTCVLCEGGHVRHFTTDQLLVQANATFEIRKDVQ